MAGIAVAASLIVGLTIARPVNTVVERVTDGKLGAVSSPVIQSPYFSFGGVTEWASHTDGAIAATTTPCALQSPAATSTIQFGSFRVASTSASATYIEFGKSTTPYATTTSLGILTLGAGAQGTLVASTTANWASLDGSAVFSPNTYFVAKVAGAGNTQLNGTCNAVWVQN